ncbi:unnamed protein product, partial [marine sediment metagenome]
MFQDLEIFIKHFRLIPCIMNYRQLLEKAKKEMPKSVHEKERFEMPPIKGHIQGTKTI